VTLSYSALAVPQGRETGEKKRERRWNEEGERNGIIIRRQSWGDGGVD
jgi:hypothetical protein